MFYAVVSIETGRLVYAGTSLLAAATVLRPGHVYGKGSSKLEAVKRAFKRLKEQYP